MVTGLERRASHWKLTYFTGIFQAYSQFSAHMVKSMNHTSWPVSFLALTSMFRLAKTSKLANSEPFNRATIM